jgi:hypothetical protein
VRSIAVGSVAHRLHIGSAAMARRFLLLLASLVTLAATSGCFSPALAVPDRSAIEEEVTSGAVLHTIHRLSFDDVASKQTRELRLAVPRGSDEARARVELWTSGSVRPFAVSEGSRFYRTATFFTFIGPFRFTDLKLGPPPGEEH